MDYSDNANYYLEDFIWQLDVPHWEITSRDIKYLHAADMLQQGKLSLRGLTRETGIPKSTMQDFIYERLGYICSELKLRVTRQLKWNRENCSSFRGTYRRNRRSDHL